MAFTDKTAAFKALVNKTPQGNRRPRTLKRPRRDDYSIAMESTSKEYIHEGYNILSHINELEKMLKSVRRAYLDVSSEPSTFRKQPPRNLDLGGADKSWSSIRHLTNEERDQIDLQARLIISKCAQRVKDMELVEKKRSELVAADANPFLRLLPSRLRQDSTSVASANMAAHHSSITYYLNRRLTEVGQFQKEMQEERISRQTERSRTFGSGAAREAAYLGIGDPLVYSDASASTSSPRSWAEGAVTKLGIASTPASSGTRVGGSFIAQQGPSLDDSEDEYDDMELSASQIQQFESENANILQSVQDKLAAVQQAESRLLDISALQMELVAHLTKQVEVTDQLYEDAITTSEAVEKGNVQLKEAKRRAKDSRLYILVFLFGASFALLFLHYY